MENLSKAEEAKVTDQRTNQQNKALYKYYELVAEALNEKGLDMRTVLKPEVDIPWTKDSVKIHMWMPIQKIMMDSDSTTELSTVDPSKIYDVVNRLLSDKFGVHVPFPSKGE